MLEALEDSLSRSQYKLGTMMYKNMYEFPFYTIKHIPVLVLILEEDMY